MNQIGVFAINLFKGSMFEAGWPVFTTGGFYDEIFNDQPMVQRGFYVYWDRR